MDILKRLFGRLDGPLLHGVLAGCAIIVISSLGLFYLWHSARAAQLAAVRTELVQLARVAATQGVYTAILDNNRIYLVTGTDYLHRIDGDGQAPDPIMTPYDADPALRRALEQHAIAVDEEPVKEAVRSYMSAFAPFYDSQGRFVGVAGVDMWLRDFDTRIGAIRRAGIDAFAAVALLSVLAGFVVYRLSRTASRARRRDRIVQARLSDAKQQAEVQAQRAEAASKAKSDFLAMMSHEIRTPMNGVLGFANLLLETQLDPEQREFAQTVQRSGDALLAVINDVLDYSKIEAGRMTVEQIDFDLRSVCDEVRSILLAAVAKQGLVMSLSYDATLPRFIKGDPARLRQVLLNLAGNAVKFTERGTVHIEVSRLDGAQVKISVDDSGIGISAEQMDRLFRRFTQADSSTTRRYGGTGLGLAISKTLVELMGGTIGAQSHAGTGSTFWITLPLIAAVQTQSDTQAAKLPGAPRTAVPTLRAVVPEPIIAQAPATLPPGTVPVGASRVLLVEDNFVNQRVAVYMLSKLGHRVDVAKHGREAIDMLGKSAYDIVLMDCQMPEMDGFEATRVIRDRTSAVLDHEIPVVAMTANAFPEDRARALACGMNDFLAKPVERAVLASMLEKWLEPVSGREPRAAAG
jgi:signal transduction histidine kinase/ActR/RegA family two-component response regulator